MYKLLPLRMREKRVLVLLMMSFELESIQTTTHFPFPPSFLSLRATPPISSSLSIPLCLPSEAQASSRWEFKVSSQYVPRRSLPPFSLRVLPLREMVKLTPFSFLLSPSCSSRRIHGRISRITRGRRESDSYRVEGAESERRELTSSFLL